MMYPTGTNKISLTCKCLTVFFWTFSITYFLIFRVFNDWNYEGATFVEMLGYQKMFISLIKYIPQAYWNYLRKSTVGWSILNILLDFTGGSFSFAQIVIDSFYKGDNFNVFSGSLNVTKFGLSIISMLFDILFMFQHYVLYPENSKKKIEERNFSMQAAKPLVTATDHDD